MCVTNVHYTHGKKQTLLAYFKASTICPFNGHLKIWFHLFLISLCIFQFVRFSPVYKSFSFFSGPGLLEGLSSVCRPVSRQAPQPGVQTTRSSSRSLRSSSRSTKVRTQCAQPQQRRTCTVVNGKRGGSASEESSM